jgi:hypothetical protein
VHPVPAAKTALKAILAARGAWSAVDIRDVRNITVRDVSRDMFWFEPTEIPEDAWTAGAMRGLTFRLGFTVALIREGDDERATEDLVWTLVEDLMSALKASPTLTNTIRNVGTVTGRQTNEPFDRMWRAGFTGSIECQSNFY